MLGIGLLFAFIALGTLTAWRLFARAPGQARLLIGAVLGYIYMMWLPSLFAFSMDFTLAAQWYALALAALMTAGVWLVPRRLFSPLEKRPSSAPPVWLTLALVVPFVILSGYLQYTHVLREVDGALHVGQSTYGDLCLHLGIATGLRGASYPPEYTLLPGTLLGYPFLFDALSASMLLMGSSLGAAFVLPGTIAMGLVYWAFVLFAWEISRDHRAVIVAFLLTFLNGGLGFLYVLDGWPSDGTMLREVMEGFYRAPTNMPDLNLRWSNVICDMMIPQRTLLGGWMMLLPALYMLARALRTQERFWFVALGIWAGLMPMVHTHSFLALGLLSAGAMAMAVWRADDRAALARKFLLYAGIALALSLPQLLMWTFPQTAQGGSLKFWFNWVNRTDDGFIDGYFWFWIKNVGPAYVLMIPAALGAPKKWKPLCMGALLIYVVAELFLFQPNKYDNNKLFYVAFIVMTPFVGRLISGLYARMKGVRGRALLGAVFLAVCLTSGVMTVAREVVSDYQLFGAEQVAAAEYIDERAYEDAVFLTGEQHTNAVAALAGRKIVCGAGTYLYFHGIDYSRQQRAVRAMYETPEASRALFDEYAVDYIYLSSHERGKYAVDESALRAMFPVWLKNGQVTVLAVSARARSQLGLSVL